MSPKFWEHHDSGVAANKKPLVNLGMLHPSLKNRLISNGWCPQVAKKHGIPHHVAIWASGEKNEKTLSFINVHLCPSRSSPLKS